MSGSPTRHRPRAPTHRRDRVPRVKALVLGGTGMLGHKVSEVFSSRFDTWSTVRSAPQSNGILPAERVIPGVHVEDLDTVAVAVATARPDVIVNCVGIVKQLAAAKAAIPSIEVNALFPHRLAKLAESVGAQMIQISTDCVFSGRKGFYSEGDEPDPVDLYGRTKQLGETECEHTLTVRTSIVGRELTGANGLLEWFLLQSGSVRGFRRAIFSGVTTRTLAETLALVIEEHPTLNGVWHVASEPINKYDLLREFARVNHRDLRIEPDDSVEIDRSLNDKRFRAATQTTRPAWPEMLDELTRDPTPYEELRAIAC
jgi:dTDP-4-dehydrorhamnose reductase